MELIELVNDYRQERHLKGRTILAETIISQVEPALRLFIFNKVHPSAIDDVMQEIMIAIATNLGKFRGETEKQFWSWCYRIARNKASDSRNDKKAKRMVALPIEELWPLVEASAADNAISPQDRLDLEYALNLLIKSKPECRDFLWNRHVIGLDYDEMIIGLKLKSDAMRMKIGRCMEIAQKLMAS